MKKNRNLNKPKGILPHLPEKVTFPVKMMTPTELSSLASLNARISSLIVCGRNAFLRSGLLIVIYKVMISAFKDNFLRYAAQGM